MSSIIEKIARFAELADELAEPLNENELGDLLKDIETHAGRVYEYFELIEADANRLRKRADSIRTAYMQQKKKAESIKSYLKTALKANGFTKLKAGDLRMSLSTTTKLVPKHQPSEFEFINKPEWCESSMAWSREPDVGDYASYPGLVTTTFDWNLPVLKQAAKDGDQDANNIFDKVEIDRLTVRVNKEG